MIGIHWCCRVGVEKRMVSVWPRAVKTYQ